LRFSRAKVCDNPLTAGTGGNVHCGSGLRLYRAQDLRQRGVRGIDGELSILISNLRRRWRLLFQGRRRWRRWWNLNWGRSLLDMYSWLL